jgi:hypothetical protein
LFAQHSNGGGGFLHGARRSTAKAPRRRAAAPVIKSADDKTVFSFEFSVFSLAEKLTPES